MKIAIWAIGKTNEQYLEEGIALYEKRLKHYISLEINILPDVKLKTADANQLKIAEGKLLLSKLGSEDYLVLLDELGTHLGSVEFSKWIEKRMAAGGKRIVFCIGGAFGFSEEVYARASTTLSLSKMTFSHQMIRLFFIEQLYRAMTILRNEPYHNEGR